MKIYDISQELFCSNVYPGDEAPTYERPMQIAKGDICNLTTLKMCAHNGTHVDAPYHFYDEGKKIDELDLNRVIGEATVVEFHGELKAEDIDTIMKTGKKRILFKGKTVVTLEAAIALNSHGVLLVGNESQTVGPEDGPAKVHYELLGKEVILLEGIVLKHVSEGNYFLNAAPLNLGGADGSPCRAILMEGVVM
jgi:arylformamidase